MASERPTFEEACRCPNCGEPGEDRSQKLAPGMPVGTKIHMVYCVKTGCDWFNTPWMVQTNPDGTVPPPRDHRGEAKLYVGFENHDQLARDIKAAMELDRKNQQRAGYEVRKPRDL